MALINCEDCGKEVSDKAKACIGCGAPILVAKKYFDKAGNPRAPFKWEIERDSLGKQPARKYESNSLNQETLSSEQTTVSGPVIHQHVYQGNEKSMAVGLLLTFFFGPLGLLYTNVKAGLILTAATFILMIPSLGLSLGLGWIGSMVWAAIDIDKINKGQAPIIRDF